MDSTLDATVAVSVPSPAQQATDDVLLLVFSALAEGFCAPDAPHKLAAARFTWFRTTLPLVCTRWHRLVLHTPALWSTAIISPAAEAHAARRSIRQQQLAQGDAHAAPAAAAAVASPLTQRPGFFLDASESSPPRGGSPMLGSSPDSDLGGYWSSHFAPLPGGASPRHIQQRLSHLSTGRQHARVMLSAAAVTAWLGAHPAAASGIASLSLDLSHHAGSSDFDTASLDRLLQKLPKVTRVTMAGAVEGTDAYEPIARLRNLESLELSSASQACLDGGMLALCFLPHLRNLCVSLDIAPAFPMALNDLPSTLQSLRLGAMWLDGMPAQIADCVGLTSIVLERCQLEENPLPLLLTLPSLSCITIRTASRGSTEASLPVLTPMRRPQQQLLLQHPGSSTGGRGSRGACTQARTRAAVVAPAGSGVVGEAAGACFVNTSITSLSLVDIGLRHLPGCISQLVALEELQLALNHDMALNPATCLPQELTCLSGLKSLCLGNCSLHHLPPVVAALTGLTRLELQGNTLSAAGFSSSGLEPHSIGFAHSLKLLDLTAQGSGRARMRGIPAWVGQCSALTELRLGCSCLGYHGGGDTSSSNGLAAAMVASASAAAGTGQARGPGGAGSRPFHHSSSDVGVQRGHAGSSSRGPGVGSVGRRLDLGHAASAPPAGSAAGSPAATSNEGASRAATAAADGLSLQQLPVLLPQLQLLVLEGGVWEQRAVREALQLVAQLAKTGSGLQLVLPL